MAPSLDHVLVVRGGGGIWAHLTLCLPPSLMVALRVRVTACQVSAAAARARSLTIAPLIQLGPLPILPIGSRDRDRAFLRRYK